MSEVIENEYLTVVHATIKVEIHSERPLTEEEVQDMMSEADYSIGESFSGTSEQYIMEDHEPAYVCGTEWMESEITSQSSLFFNCAN